MQRIHWRIIHNSRGRARETAEYVVFLQQPKMRDEINKTAMNP
jgi:hypothetical protein